MRIDHVIYLTADLDAAAARAHRALGLPVVPGGRHEGQGTHNLLMPFGGGYLEFLAIEDREEAAASPVGSLLAVGWAALGVGLFAWGVAVDAGTAHADRLGTSLYRVSRDGLTAASTGVFEALRDPLLPFFITRDAGVPDPGDAGDGGGIEALELCGDRARLEAWLGGPLPERVDVADGPPAIRGLRVGGRLLHDG